MRVKLLEGKEHLDNLNKIIKDQDHNTRSLAQLTKSVKDGGFGTMSHQTIHDHLSGKHDIKYDQMREYVRILQVVDKRLSINHIINNKVSHCEIILYWSNKKKKLKQKAFDRKMEYLYFLDRVDINPDWRAIYYPPHYIKDAEVQIVNIQNRDFATKEGRDAMLHKECVLYCGDHNQFFWGIILEWTDPKKKMCKFQSWKGNVSTEKGMIVNDWEILDCRYEVVYPIICSLNFRDSNLKKESVSV